MSDYYHNLQKYQQNYFLKKKKHRRVIIQKSKKETDIEVKVNKVNRWLLVSKFVKRNAEKINYTFRFLYQEKSYYDEIENAKEDINLKLTSEGPYYLDVSKDESRIAIGTKKGRLSELQWQNMQLIYEIKVDETLNDIKFLYLRKYVAAAQKKYVYIYNYQGVDSLCLRDHFKIYKLEFLSLQMLLVSVGEQGLLIYHDMSTGLRVAQHKTHNGSCKVMKQNNWNAVICLGHNNGCVTMWTPNERNPISKMLCHRGPIQALASDQTGNFLVTTGADCQIKLWDLRTLQPLQQYFSKDTVKCVEISQKGFLALAFRNRVQIWKEAFKTKQSLAFLNHTFTRSHISSLAFCPYADTLVIGHSNGITSISVPGANEQSQSTHISNSTKGNNYLRELEVRQLIEKLDQETIINPKDFKILHKENKKKTCLNYSWDKRA